MSSEGWSYAGIVGIVAAGLVAFAAAARAAEAVPENPLADLQRAYEETTDLRARFVQTSRTAVTGMDQEQSGWAAFRKGGRMRWEYEGDDPQVIVSDGETLWIHQVRDRTVLRQELASIPAANRLALDLLGGFQDVEEAFEVSSCGARCLELRPREPRPDLERVRVEVTEDRRGVRSVTTEDPLGNRTRVEFDEIRRNTGVEDAVFRFQPPPEAQVLDMGEPR